MPINFRSPVLQQHKWELFLGLGSGLVQHFYEIASKEENDGLVFHYERKCSRVDTVWSRNDST